MSVYTRSGTTAILRILKKDFRLYLIWSMVYFTVIFWENPALASIRSIKWMTIDFFVYGSYYHLWYMAAVLWCLLALFVLYKQKMIKVLKGGTIALYLLGLLGTSYYLVGEQIPGFSSLFQSTYFTTIRRVWLMGFPFMSLGWLIYERKSRILKIPLRSMIIALLITFALFVTEIIIVVVRGMARSIIITIFLYPLVALIFIFCIRLPMEKYNKLGAYCGSMSGIVYFMHPIVILLLRKSGITGNKLQFLLTTAICIMVSGSAVFYQQQGKKRKLI